MHNWFECKVSYEKMLENGGTHGISLGLADQSHAVGLYEVL